MTYICKDCGCDTEEIGEYNYILRDEIWEQVWPGTTFHSYAEMQGKYILCIECTEKRLGRELTPEDFNPDYCGIYDASAFVQTKAGVPEEEQREVYNNTGAEDKEPFDLYHQRYAEKKKLLMCQGE